MSSYKEKEDLLKLIGLEIHLEINSNKEGSQIICA